MCVIGITGALGTGKSTVAAMFQEYGARVLDADKIARRQLYRNSPCFAEIVRCFGEDILTRQRIDRRKLAHVVFNDFSRLRRLEKIIHPVVRQRILKGIKTWKKKGTPTVIDVPLLFETGLDKEVDYTVVVKANRSRQWRRAARRLGISREEFLRRLQAQIPLREKIQQADFVIDNNGNLSQTRKQVKKIWRSIYGKINTIQGERKSADDREVQKRKTHEHLKS